MAILRCFPLPHKYDPAILHTQNSIIPDKFIETNTNLNIKIQNQKLVCYIRIITNGVYNLYIEDIQNG